MITIKKIGAVFTLLLIVINLFAQTDSLNKRDNSYIVGKCTRIELQKGDFGNYFLEEYRNYDPDMEVLEGIKTKIFNYNIKIVLGTWCSDSQEQVPGFIKVLDDLNYNTNYLEIICVDKEKKAGDLDISMLNIEKVPTFIFYKDNKEAGRIVETPTNTLETDIYNILME